MVKVKFVHEEQRLALNVLRYIDKNLLRFKQVLGLKAEDSLPDSLRRRISLGRNLLNSGKPLAALGQLKSVYLLMNGMIPKPGGIPVKKFKSV